MSQHSFDTTFEGQPVIILVAHDRPLRGFFCFVEKGEAGGDDDEDEFVYSYLDDPKLARCFGLPKSLDYFKGVLHELGVWAPASMFEQSELRGDVGNRCVSQPQTASSPDLVCTAIQVLI